MNEALRALRDHLNAQPENGAALCATEVISRAEETRLLLAAALATLPGAIGWSNIASRDDMAHLHGAEVTIMKDGQS